MMTIVSVVFLHSALTVERQDRLAQAAVLLTRSTVAPGQWVVTLVSWVPALLFVVRLDVLAV